MLPTLILAGGLGTRLHPFTQNQPKSLVPVLGKPFVYHQLTLLKQQGIDHIIFCVGNHGAKIEAYIKECALSNLKIEFHYDGETLLGTAGCIRKIYNRLPERFFVLYGDAYLPCHYLDLEKTFKQSQNALALMTVFHNCQLGDKSNVYFENNQIVSYDKIAPHPKAEHIDYGVGLFHRSAFLTLPENLPYDLAALYQRLLKNQQLASHEVRERFYEVGSWKGIQDLEHYLRKHSPCLNLSIL